MRVNKNKSVPFCWKPNTLFMQILRKILSLKRGLTVLFRPKVWPLCLLPLLKLSDMWPRHTMLLLRERHGWRRKCQFLRVLKDNNLYDKFQTLELTHCCFLDWTLYLRGLPGHLRGFLFLALGRIPSLIRESPRLNSPNFQQHMTWMFSFKKKYGQKSRRKYQRCEITKMNPPWVMFSVIFWVKKC